MAENILGTTTDKGLGGNRKSRTATYQGGMRLNTGGNPGGVSLGSGRISASAAGVGSVRAPHLQARNMDAFIQRTPEAKGPLIDAKTAEQGMSHIARSLDNYVNETEQLRAVKATVDLKEEMFKLLHGNPDSDNPVEAGGYIAMKGFMAVDGYQGYSQQIDTLMKDSLEGLNPMARQKAVMGMFALRDSYLKEGSAHAVTAKGDIHDMNVAAQRQGIEAELFAMPYQALDTIVVDEDGNKSTAMGEKKIEFLNTFPVEDLDTGIKAWEGMMFGIGEKIYFDNAGRKQKDGTYEIGSGLNDAQVWRNTVGAKELSGPALAEFDKKLYVWGANEASMYVVNDNEKEAADNITKTRTQTNNYATTMEALFDPEQESPSMLDVTRMMKTGELNSTQWSAYKTAFNQQSKTVDPGVANPALATQIEKHIEALASSHSLVSDRAELTTIITQANLPRAETKALQRFLRTNSNSKYNANMKEASSIIDDIIPQSMRPTGGISPSNLPIEVETTTSDMIERYARDEYKRLTDPYSEKPITHDEAISSIRKKYASGEAFFSAIPHIPRIGKPSTVPEYKQALRMLKHADQTGTMTEQEMFEARKNMNECLAYLQFYKSKGVDR